MEEQDRTERVEEWAEDDPRNHEDNPQPPPGEESDEEHHERIAGKSSDLTDEESYEGGLPA